MNHATSEPSFAKLAQRYLRDKGFYGGKIDGNFGPASEQAYHNYLVAMEGSVPLWPAVAKEPGAIITKGIATFFGGRHDDMDNGLTASGGNTFDPMTRGCALPLPRPNFLPTAGTLLPNLPWGTLVEVTAGDRKITCPLIDLGPNQTLPEKRPIDLTRQSFLDLGGKLADGRMMVEIRILT